MEFRVGGHIYSVEIIAEPKIDIDGREFRGEVCTQDMKIYIYAPGRDFWGTLLHEYYHLWQIHTPRTKDDDEAEADLFATAASSLIRDLMSQGYDLNELMEGKVERETRSLKD